MLFYLVGVVLQMQFVHEARVLNLVALWHQGHVLFDVFVELILIQTDVGRAGPVL